MNTTPVVELENLKVRLGRREILHGITCRLGVSGTGKAVGLLSARNLVAVLDRNSS